MKTFRISAKLENCLLNFRLIVLFTWKTVLCAFRSFHVTSKTEHRIISQCIEREKKHSPARDNSLSLNVFTSIWAAIITTSKTFLLVVLEALKSAVFSYSLYAIWSEWRIGDNNKTAMHLILFTCFFQMPIASSTAQPAQQIHSWWMITWDSSNRKQTNIQSFNSFCCIIHLRNSHRLIEYPIVLSTKAWTSQK